MLGVFAWMRTSPAIPALAAFLVYGLFNIAQTGPGLVSGAGVYGVELAPTRIRSVAQSITVIGGPNRRGDQRLRLSRCSTRHSASWRRSRAGLAGPGGRIAQPSAGARDRLALARGDQPGKRAERSSSLAASPGCQLVALAAPFGRVGRRRTRRGPEMLGKGHRAARGIVRKTSRGQAARSAGLGRRRRRPSWRGLPFAEAEPRRWRPEGSPHAPNSIAPSGARAGPAGHGRRRGSAGRHGPVRGRDRRLRRRRQGEPAGRLPGAVRRLRVHPPVDHPGP